MEREVRKEIRGRRGRSGASTYSKREVSVYVCLTNRADDTTRWTLQTITTKLKNALVLVFCDVC